MSEKYLTFNEACAIVREEISTDDKCRELSKRINLTFKTLRDLRYRTDELNPKILRAFGFDIFCVRVMPYREYSNHVDDVKYALKWDGPFAGTTTLRTYLREEGRPINRTSLVNILRRLKDQGLVAYDKTADNKILNITWLGNS